MSTVTLYLRGDQIGRYDYFNGHGNNADRVVEVHGVKALGTPHDSYRVVVEQVNHGATEFQNGQFMTVYDSHDNVVVPRNGVQPDIEQGLGGGDEHLILNNQPFLIDLGGLPKGPSTVKYTRADDVAARDVGDNDGRLDFNDFPCFARGTLIDTPAGPVDVDSLQPGDLICTRDHGDVPVLWVGRRTLDLTATTAQPTIQIKAGFFGPGQPTRDLVLSPDHRVLVGGQDCQLLFGEDEALCPSKGLLDLPLIREMHGRKKVEYVTLLTERHHVIRANGLAVETLYPGPEALSRLGPLGAARVLGLLPRLRDTPLAKAYPAARPLLSVQEAQTLCKVMRRAGRHSAHLAPVDPPQAELGLLG